MSATTVYIHDTMTHVGQEWLVGTPQHEHGAVSEKRPFKLPVTVEYDERGARLLVDATDREIAVCDTSEDAEAIAECLIDCDLDPALLKAATPADLDPAYRRGYADGSHMAVRAAEIATSTLCEEIKKRDEQIVALAQAARGVLKAWEQWPYPVPSMNARMAELAQTLEAVDAARAKMGAKA